MDIQSNPTLIPNDYANRFLFDGSGASFNGSGNATITNPTYEDSDTGYQTEHLVWEATTSCTYSSITYTNSYIFIDGVFTKNSSEVSATALTGTTGQTYAGLTFFNRTLTTQEERALELEGLRRLGSTRSLVTPIDDTISGTVKALVVGGGGGGGSGVGAGGGAGGVVYNASLSITSLFNTVIVGSGGSGAASASLPGNNGTNSVFSSITGIGGGGGGSNLNSAGISGGCGGGNSGTSTTAYTVGVGSQGFNGGVHNNSAPAYGSGGGGGMGAAGSAGSATTGGNGGIGITNSISGSSVYYGGGGGGSTYNGQGTAGSGGTGGGGNASVSGSGSNGTANTGGGGGGSASNVSGQAVGIGGTGGSGVVIISYATDGSDGIDPAEMEGGIITTSGTQTIHTFTSSGYFGKNKISFPYYSLPNLQTGKVLEISKSVVSGTYYDQSGNGNNGTATSMTDSISGLNNVMNFTATGYINFGNILQREYTQAWTICFWHKFTHTGSNKPIITNQSSVSPNKGQWIDTNNGKYSLALYSGTTSSIELTTTNTFNDGKWHFVSFTYNGNGLASGVKCYIDNVEETISNQNIYGTRTQSIGGSIVSTGQTLQINGRWNSTNSTDIFNMTKPEIYNKALSEAEIQQLYYSSFIPN